MHFACVVWTREENLVALWEKSTTKKYSEKKDKQLVRQTNHDLQILE